MLVETPRAPLHVLAARLDLTADRKKNPFLRSDDMRAVEFHQLDQLLVDVARHEANAVRDEALVLYLIQGVADVSHMSLVCHQ